MSFASAAAVAAPYVGAAGGGLMGALNWGAYKRFARENREWATRMSNTAYRRAMYDMKAAGLNPILAYKQGGAGVPSVPGSQAPDLGGSAAKLGQAATAANVARSQMKTQEAQRNLMGTQGAQQVQSAEALRLDNVEKAKRLKVYKENPDMLKTEMQLGSGAHRIVTNMLRSMGLEPEELGPTARKALEQFMEKSKPAKNPNLVLPEWIEKGTKRMRGDPYTR